MLEKVNVVNIKDYMKSDWFTFAVLLFLRVSSVNRLMRGMGILTLENRTFVGAEMQMTLGQQGKPSLGKSLLKA